MTNYNLTSTYEASLTDAIGWARTVEAGSYLVEYADTGMSPEQDPGSRCGYGDDEIDAIEKELRKRGLKLSADDRGLIAESARAADGAINP